MRLLCVLLLGAAGCCNPKPQPAAPNVPTVPVIVKVSTPCLAEPPPKELPLELLAPPQECPAAGPAGSPKGATPQLSGCLDVPAAMALEHNVRSMRRWIKEAWARCKQA
jgi:hypothetical protein